MGSSSTRVLEQFSNEPKIPLIKFKFKNLKREKITTFVEIVTKASCKIKPKPKISKFVSNPFPFFIFFFKSQKKKRLFHYTEFSNSRTRDPLNPIAGWQTPGERFNRFNHRIVDTLIDRSFTCIEESRSNKRATTGQSKRERELRATFEGRRKGNLFEHSGCSRCRPLQTTTFSHKAPPRSHSSKPLWISFHVRFLFPLYITLCCSPFLSTLLSQSSPPGFRAINKNGNHPLRSFFHFPFLIDNCFLQGWVNRKENPLHKGN